MNRKFAVGVVGSNDPGGMEHALALGKLIGNKEWVVITGGRNEGVMAQVNKGVKASVRKLAWTVGILPSVKSEASPNVDVVVYTDLNNARNNIIGLSCDVLVACGVVGAGTASEVALAVKNNKCQVVILDTDPLAKAFFENLDGEISFVSTPDEALRVCESAFSRLG